MSLFHPVPVFSALWFLQVIFLCGMLHVGMKAGRAVRDSAAGTIVGAIAGLLCAIGAVTLIMHLYSLKHG